MMETENKKKYEELEQMAAKLLAEDENDNFDVWKHTKKISDYCCSACEMAGCVLPGHFRCTIPPEKAHKHIWKRDGVYYTLNGSFPRFSCTRCNTSSYIDEEGDRIQF